MLGSAPSVEIRRPPHDLDALIEWFDRVSYRLVLLEEYPLPEVVAAVDAFEEGVRRHLAAVGSARQWARPPPPACDGAIPADHARFETSLEQLRWFLAVVQHEDHGGHRQALGQYGRLFVEALRRHRLEERGRPEGGPPAAGRVAPGKP